MASHQLWLETSFFEIEPGGDQVPRGQELRCRTLTYDLRTVLRRRRVTRGNPVPGSSYLTFAE